MNVFHEFGITILLALLLAALVWTVSRRREMTRPEPRRHTGDVVFRAQLFLYALVLGALSILRHQSFHSYAGDLGIFDQVIWNSLHGRLFENSIRLDAPSFLGHHFSPILLALVPFYAVWSDAVTLLIVQTLALALAAAPIYWFARERVGGLLSLSVTSAYFLFPAGQNVNLVDFHEIALVTPLLTLAVYFLLHRRYPPFGACLTLALLVKEEIVFVAIGFGLYLAFAQHKWRHGLALVLVGAVYAITLFRFVIPFFLGNSFDTNFYIMDRYAYLGNTISEIAVTIITQPGLVAQHLLVPPKIEFILQLLVPLAFVPLVGAEVFALAVPTLTYLLIGDHAYQNSICCQYTAPLVPFLFFALVIGLERLVGWQARNRFAAQRALATLLVVASLINYFFQSHAPLGRHFDRLHYTLDERVLLGHRLVAAIPPGASVVAQANLVPHLSERRYIYEAPVVADLRPIEYLMADTRFGPHQVYASTWNDVLSSPQFETLAAQDGYILKRRAALRTAFPLAVRFDERITLLGFTPEYAEPARRGETIAFVLLWRADAAIRERYVIFAHLIDARDRIGAQGDREPGNGWFRTDRWNTGDLTLDRYEMEWDEPVPPGTYLIRIGLYNSKTGVRLRVPSGDDDFILMTIRIE